MGPWGYVAIAGVGLIAYSMFKKPDEANLQQVGVHKESSSWKDITVAVAGMVTGVSNAVVSYENAQEAERKEREAEEKRAQEARLEEQKKELKSMWESIKFW
jgi:predicted histidine transporter YuiF (NhaC family)